MRGISVYPTWQMSSIKMDPIFALRLNFAQWYLGFAIEDWGVRLMFVWWHVCVPWRAL